MRISVHGANGYQGKLVVVDLLRRGIDPVLVGRNESRLRAAAAELGLKAADVRIATADDAEAMASALRESDAIVNCAAPFTESGEAVVQAAIAAGCHYVDTAGEQLFVKRIFDAYDSAAQRAGCTVVPAMNDDNLPASLIAQLVAALVEPVDEMVVAVRLEAAGASRGSLRSAMATMDVLVSGGVTYENGSWHTGIDSHHSSMRFPDSTEDTPVVKFPLPPVVTIPRHVAANRVEGVMAAGLLEAFTGITPDIIDTLPEGPTEQQRQEDRFTVVVDALGQNGRRARGVVRGTDSYGITAVIAVEGARRLVADGAAAGVLAPAHAFDAESFLDYLGEFGTTWSTKAVEETVRS